MELFGDHEFAAALFKCTALLLRAGDGHGEGAGELEAENLHEVLAIYTAQAVGQGHGTQGRGQCNKSLSFGSMEVEALLWRTVWCLVWQAVLTLLSTLAINGLAMFWFNRKGELRRHPKKEK